MHVLMLIACYFSDQMGNKGAFITLTTDLKPKFTSYDAVVSTLRHTELEIYETIRKIILLAITLI